MPICHLSRYLKTAKKPGMAKSLFDPDRVRLWLVILALSGLTLTALSGTLRNGFVYDDVQYLLENRALAKGLNATSIRWSFTSFYASNWHPLTWLSHALDISLYQLTPMGHHATNLGLHISGVILLFVLLNCFTARLWPSAVTAALFAIHPLHVESVAWVAERKDVLSGAFFMLTLLFWLRYVRKPALSRYLLAAATFAMGLMSKPMLVTLPFLLILLDYWPLGRHRARPSGFRALLVEKVPFFVLAMISSVLTLVAQRGTMIPLAADYAFASRLSNAIVSCVAYLGKCAWPAGLVVFYPYRGSTAPLGSVALSAAFLAGASALVLLMRKRGPFLAVGWFWYLGMLVPVIGLVQVGSQAMADRYTYLPSVGVFLAVGWGAWTLARLDRRLRMALATVAVTTILVLVLITKRQVAYWHDQKSLFGHALAVTPDNPIAHDALGMALLEEGHFDEALWHIQEAVRVLPYSTPYFHLGICYARRGSMPEAIRSYRMSIALQPDHREARNNLGVALAATGALDEAIEELRVSIRLKPDEVMPHYNLGVFLERRGLRPQAAEQFREVLRLDPADLEARANLERLAGAVPRQ